MPKFMKVTTTDELADDAAQQYTYNSFSQVTRYTDPNNNATTFTYDANGRLTQVKDALNNVTTFTSISRSAPVTRTG